MTDYQLDAVQIQLDKETDSTVKLTPEMRETYYRIGGTPHLDGQYTVFGEVVEGLDVVDRIQMTETDERNRPIKDVRIIRAKIVR